MAETNKNGVYFDTKNGKVVESQPEEGVQLAAPGVEITPAIQADIDRYRDIENGVEREPETVSTKGVEAGVAAAVEKSADTTTPRGRKG